ncbi:MAG: hypothetical protein KKF68_01175 [Nanoarchaeota archaeon]|nr:hypothetical protein [Nanoarchaeota archaeon]
MGLNKIVSILPPVSVSRRDPDWIRKEAIKEREYNRVGWYRAMDESGMQCWVGPSGQKQYGFKWPI